MKRTDEGRGMGFVWLVGLVFLVGTASAWAVTIYPPDYSFETPAVAPNVDPSPLLGADWKTLDAFAGEIWHPDPTTVYPTGNPAIYWYPAPSDGIQSLGWIPKGTTVFQLIPDQIQAGTSYVLKADAGDGRVNQYEAYHPTVVLSLCSGDSATDPSTWATLAETTTTLSGFGDVFTVSTPEYIGAGADVGKRFGIKLTYSSTGYSVNYDLTWDNVRIDAVPEPATLVLLTLGGIMTVVRRKVS